MDTLHESVMEPYPDMLEAVSQLRKSGLKTALLTNNWYQTEEQMARDETMIGSTLAPYFDVVSLE